MAKCDAKGFAIFGIPIIENTCSKNQRAKERRDYKENRKEIEEKSDTLKRKEHSDRVQSRQEQQALGQYFRNADGSNPSETIAQAGFGAIPGTAGAIAGAVAATTPFGAVGSLFGLGGTGSTDIVSSLLPLMLIGGGLLVAVSVAGGK